jgi:transposase
MEDGIMAVSLPDARHLSDEVLEALRLRALRGCELGFSEGDVADLLGVARETVSRWWSAYQSAGLDALPHERSGRPVGSGRTLSDSQAAHLQQILDNRTPEEVGVPAPLWNRRAVRDLIRQQYGILMPVRTVGAYLRRWGYTLKTPQRHSQNQDPEEVRQWLEETYPTIQRRAAEEGATIHWCDETGVGADEHPGRGYGREGHRVTVEVPDSHIRVNVVSTITNEGAVHFMTYTQMMTAALFITFLERLLRSTSGKLFVIVDWLSAHDAWKVLAWADAHLERIELFFLPRYAPERNADEYLNNDLKGQVNAEGLAHDRPELRSRIQVVLQRLAHLPEHVRHYFQHPSMQYATELK